MCEADWDQPRNHHAVGRALPRGRLADRARGLFGHVVHVDQADPAGLVTLTATGTISHVVVTEQVHAVVGGAGTLAVTGHSGPYWWTELAVGLAPIVAGGRLALTAMRRRGRHAHHI